MRPGPRPALAVLLALAAACRPTPPGPHEQPHAVLPASAVPTTPAALHAQAEVDLEHGRLDAAESGARAALRALPPSDLALRFALQVQLAEIARRRGRPEEALRLLRAARATPLAPPRVQVQASLSEGSALCEAARGEAAYERAQALLSDAARRAAATQDERLRAVVQLRRGKCALDQQRFDAADRLTSEALRMARAVGSPQLEAYASGNLGLIRLQTERYDAAAQRFRHTLALVERLGDDLARVKTILNLAVCDLSLGDAARALPALLEGASLAERRNYPGELRKLLFHVGLAYQQLGRYDEAAALYHQAAQVPRDGEAPEIANRQAQLAWLRGRFEEAESFAQRALATLAEPDAPAGHEATLLLAKIWNARRQPERALRAWRSVLAARHVERNQLWQAHAGLAVSLAARGDLAAAESQFGLAFRAMEIGRAGLAESETRLSFTATLAEFHDAYVDFLTGQGREVRALELADRSRARLLMEQLGQDGARPGVVSAARLRRLARETGATLLSYWLAPRASYVWAVSADHIEMHALPGQAALCSRVDAYQAVVQQARDPLGEQSPEGQRLFDTLLAPVAAHLPRGTRVLLVLDGCLHQLNFETLPAPGAPPRYWIEDVTLAVAPSLGALAASAPRPPADALLLIGAPLSPSDEFPPLVQAEREVDVLRELFATARVETRTGADARPEAYAAAHPERFAYVHFAAHATANRDSPLDSAVVLSPQGDDYKLYAREIMRVPLRADLVTLSACHSAGARAYAGEGLVGLAWAFLSAGARNVVAGLWNVEDGSTAELMQHLYRGLRSGRQPPDALRAAKLTLLRSGTAYSKPFYWAPFQVYTRAPAASAAPRGPAPALAARPPGARARTATADSPAPAAAR